jgi:hypothetical protein
MKYGYIALALLLANTLKLVRAILLCLHRDEGRVTW